MRTMSNRKNLYDRNFTIRTTRVNDTSLVSDSIATTSINATDFHPSLAIKYADNAVRRHSWKLSEHNAKISINLVAAKCKSATKCNAKSIAVAFIPRNLLAHWIFQVCLGAYLWTGNGRGIPERTKNICKTKYSCDPLSFNGII